MPTVPIHVASEISRTVLHVVKMNTVEPKTLEEKDVVIEAVTRAQREVIEKYGQDGSDFFIVTLAALAGGGYAVAGAALGTAPGELVDELFVNTEAAYIDRQEFPGK